MSTLVATESAPVREAPDDAADLVTEVIVGERLEALEELGDWRQVVVPDHATHLDGRGYPGWVRGGLREMGSWSPDLKVVAPNSLRLPLGALLERGPDGARLPDDLVPDLPEAALLPLAARVEQSAVELSRTFMGLPYRWGGTDTVTGMDCSGMVYRVMQLLGIAVPRDADDQFDEAPFRSREGWESARVGDLVFFGGASITHIGFYLGKGRYISEHGVGETVIREMTEDPYWGFARYET